MVEINQDLPRRLDHNKLVLLDTQPTSGTQAESKSCQTPFNKAFDDAPPGAGAVVYTRNRNTEWYCRACNRFIIPVWIRQAKHIYPSCYTCFCEELALLEGDENLGIPMELVQKTQIEAPAVAAAV